MKRGGSEKPKKKVIDVTTSDMWKVSQKDVGDN